MYSFKITHFLGTSSELSELFKLGNKQCGKPSASLVDKTTDLLNNSNDFAQKI